MFTCDIYGLPQPTLKWTRNAREINMTGGYFQIVNGKNLRILGLLESDAGFYQCFGSNDLGNIQSSAQLIVSARGKTAIEILSNM